jgi:hypothetical protein
MTHVSAAVPQVHPAGAQAPAGWTIIIAAGTFTVDALAEDAEALATITFATARRPAAETIHRVRDDVAEAEYVAGRRTDGQMFGLPVVIHNELALMQPRSGGGCSCEPNSARPLGAQGVVPPEVSRPVKSPPVPVRHRMASVIPSSSSTGTSNAKLTALSGRSDARRSRAPRLTCMPRSAIGAAARGRPCPAREGLSRSSRPRRCWVLGGASHFQVDTAYAQSGAVRRRPAGPPALLTRPDVLQICCKTVDTGGVTRCTVAHEITNVVLARRSLGYERPRH